MDAYNSACFRHKCFCVSICILYFLPLFANVHTGILNLNLLTSGSLVEHCIDRKNKFRTILM